MRLTLHTDYALRVLMYLATQKERLVSIREISQVYEISVNHLRKVIHKLARHGFIQTVRGHKGGMCLKRSPKDICLGDVVRCTEDEFAPVGCMQKDQKNRCILDGACLLKNSFSKACEAFLRELDQTKLSQVIAPQTRHILQERSQTPD